MISLPVGFCSMRHIRIFVSIFIVGFLCIYFSYSSNSVPIILTIRKSATLVYYVIEIDDRYPPYKLVTLDGQKPIVNGDRAQATIIKHLNLVDRCEKDPSLVVVDVGAFLGDFGLYAAACGCQVAFFEVQPVMVDVIETSIRLNQFSSSRVRVFNKAISDLPSNSSMTFSPQGGETTATNGSIHVSTIRLDDVSWLIASKIFLLKVDVEGFELNVLRSAEKLFQQQRIHHLISEYTAYWTDRAAQMDLLPYMEKNLQLKTFYVLHRTDSNVFGPLTRNDLDQFYTNHYNRHLQTDLYVPIIDDNSSTPVIAEPYDSISSFA